MATESPSPPRRFDPAALPPPGLAPLQRLAAALTVAIGVVPASVAAFSITPAGRLRARRNSAPCLLFQLLVPTYVAGGHRTLRSISELGQPAACRKGWRCRWRLSCCRSPVIQCGGRPDRCCWFACGLLRPRALGLCAHILVACALAIGSVGSPLLAVGQWRHQAQRRLARLGPALAGRWDMPWGQVAAACFGRLLSIAIGAPGALMPRFE